MAEPQEKSLDDFFAKRDKKKRKDKSGAGGAGGGGRTSITGTGRQQNDGGIPGARPAGKQEDEWKEFEQKEVDYSGLRIQSLQISEREDEENDKREEQGGDWEDQGGGVEKVTGPWNKTAPAQAPAPVVVETPEPVQSGVYRPPGARSGTATRKPQGPPEIYNDSQFPSLQSTAKHVESRKDREMEKTFEVVKHKSRGREEGSKNQALQLQLGNQYAVLDDQ